MAKKSKDSGHHIKEVIEKVWPKAKKRLEKGITEAKSLIEKGEKYLLDVTDKGVHNVSLVALRIKMEQLYYEIGKLVATESPEKWRKSKKLLYMLKEIGKIKKQMRSVKKKK